MTEPIPGPLDEAVPSPPDRTLAALRAPLPANLISKLPGGIPKELKEQKSHCDVCHGYHGPASFHLDYAGHAAITDRLLSVDPHWSWEPLAFDGQGLPLYETDRTGQPIGLWIRLTVGGMTRIGFGDAVGKQWGPTAIKEVIGDALRNSAMRFGVGLDLWHKGDLDAATGQDEDPGDGLLDAQECADVLYAANTDDEIGAASKRYRGTKASAEKVHVADPGTGAMMPLLTFATQCRESIAESGEPLRVRRLKRGEVSAAQDAAADDGTEPAEPSAVGHHETAAERAARIAATIGGDGA